VLLNSPTDNRIFIPDNVQCLLAEEFDLIFMLATVCDGIGSVPYPVTREARVQRKDGANHETFEVHNHLVPQVRSALHCSLFVNTRITPVSNTVEAVLSVVFVEGMHSLISRRRLLCANHGVASKCLVEKFLRNLDYFDARNVMVHLTHLTH